MRSRKDRRLAMLTDRPSIRRSPSFQSRSHLSRSAPSRRPPCTDDLDTECIGGLRGTSWGARQHLWRCGQSKSRERLSPAGWPWTSMAIPEHGSVPRGTTPSSHCSFGGLRADRLSPRSHPKCRLTPESGLSCQSALSAERPIAARSITASVAPEPRPSACRVHPRACSAS
ncbi:hypothetical protein MPTK1_2g04280 [Marchantia polymorpha subsp. ruderalis]|uniref:Uncharacterized protein n=1 Tax=Marchantia polymorpha TaxID=3197 RepID=A0A2R6X7M6_MARPO|nr:hypothetical protein MARPO_0031s0084 [Marchantia polymorpha]BBN01061.1 hypothetical protein Mp_2g04280 [Marchantia polymorpha subsp. ruderalis]|eukprot:PTQ42110.1 hypothetical protein MARPO_0031s0084 [Marchantia polymorpha]